MTSPKTVHLSLDQVRELAVRVLSHHGLAPDHVAAVAETIVAGERDGCASHGVYRLLVCAHTLRSGRVVPDAVPVVERVSLAVTRVDAKGGYAQLAFEAGLPTLLEGARRLGVAILALNNCVHFAALWPEVERLAGEGLVALACTASHSWVAPAGGRKPLFGTNPIAFGWPRPDRHPFVFDFATSAVARGEIELHRRAGKPIPLGWGLSPEGKETEIAEEALAGAMQTFGGHKGSALAAMIELLAGPLIGDRTSAESLNADAGAKASPLGGEFILALDPAGILGKGAEEHVARAEKLFDAIEAQGARLPSTRRYEARGRSRENGVDVSAELIADIEQTLV